MHSKSPLWRTNNTTIAFLFPGRLVVAHADAIRLFLDFTQRHAPRHFFTNAADVSTRQHAFILAKTRSFSPPRPRHAVDYFHLRPRRSDSWPADAMMHLPHDTILLSDAMTLFQVLTPTAAPPRQMPFGLATVKHHTRHISSIFLSVLPFISPSAEPSRCRRARASQATQPSRASCLMFLAHEISGRRRAPRLAPACRHRAPSDVFRPIRHFRLTQHAYRDDNFSQPPHLPGAERNIRSRRQDARLRLLATFTDTACRLSCLLDERAALALPPRQA